MHSQDNVCHVERLRATISLFLLFLGWKVRCSSPVLFPVVPFPRAYGTFLRDLAIFAWPRRHGCCCLYQVMGSLVLVRRKPRDRDVFDRMHVFWGRKKREFVCM